MTSEARDEALLHLNKDYVFSPPDHNSFFFEEKKLGGAGKTFFSSSSPCLVMKATDNAPLLWALRNRKCAEGAFITFEEGSCRLHIVEMKSKLTTSEWAKVLLQFNGMYLAAIATARLLGVKEFSDVICYVTYTSHHLSARDTSDMILLKPFVGKPNPVSGSDAWKTERHKLPLGGEATIRKAIRDAQSNADFGVV